jgi:hypothetical protein
LQRIFKDSISRHVAKISVCFQGLPNIAGSSTRHGRNMKWEKSSRAITHLSLRAFHHLPRNCRGGCKGISLQLNPCSEQGPAYPDVLIELFDSSGRPRALNLEEYLNDGDGLGSDLFGEPIIPAKARGRERLTAPFRATGGRRRSRASRANSKTSAANKVQSRKSDLWRSDGAFADRTCFVASTNLSSWSSVTLA